MLPKEKRRAGWSIVVGAVVAGLVAGGYYLQAFNANQRLHILVAECEKKAAPAAPNPIQALIQDPQFVKLSEPEKYEVVIGVLEKHEPGFAARDPQFKHEVATGLLQKYGHLKSSAALPADDPLAGSTPVDLPKTLTVEFVCDPKELESLRNLHHIDLSPSAAKIVDTASESDNDRELGRNGALIAFLIFVCPFAWYFFLDRIRELSAAIAGRDRSP